MDTITTKNLVDLRTWEFSKKQNYKNPRKNRNICEALLQYINKEKCVYIGMWAI